MSPLTTFQGGCRALFLDGGLQGTLFRWGITGHSFPGTSLKVLRYCQPPLPFQNLVGAQPPFPPCRKGMGVCVFALEINKNLKYLFWGFTYKNLFFKGGRAFMKNQYMGGIA